MPYRPRVVIRFDESIAIPRDGGVERFLVTKFPDAWGRVMKAFPWIELRPVFVTFRTRDDLPASTGPIHAMPRGIGMHVLPPPSARLARLFETAAPDDEAAQALVVALRSEDLRPLVSRVQVRGRRSGPPKTVKHKNDPGARFQGFQKSPPRGIGARDVWNRLGSSGAGVRIVDVEFGWDLGHRQLPGTIPLVSGVNADYRDHGVGVLGILVAEDDDAGIVGLCPKATVAVASVVRSADDFDDIDYAAAIEDAVGTMGAGDILLIEVQTRYPAFGGKEGYPLEIEQDVFAAFQEATERGIIVIEAAGNRGVDLDAFATDDHGTLLNRGLAEFEDSGAIMVGACRTADSKLKHHWLDPSNYGSRVDCYAWGEKVVTLGALPNALDTEFSDTSAAAAIVAGVAAIVQGIVRDRYQKDPTRPPHLLPAEMRQLLATIGTPSEDAAQHPIGLMPDLDRIVEAITG
jgi:hypothetical protein